MDQQDHPMPAGVTGAAGPGGPGGTDASPVPTVRSWLFDGEGRPHVVRIELPLSAGEMVAALYGEHEHLMPADLDTDEEVWEHIAVVIVQDGLKAVEQLADMIDAQEPCRSLAAPEWLALCRHRVGEVIAGTA
jgi:hypothetical protein